jgi:predicted secreted hydrolase
VIFRAERGSFPVTWASHLALTDEAGERFLYEQRSEIGPQVDRGGLVGREDGFDLAISGRDPLSEIIGLGDGATPPPDATPWQMRGRLGADVLAAAASDFALELELSSTREEPVLHDGDGWVEFGPAGGSYYYSWPRMAASGTLEYAGRTLAVDGTAWFDHQWGDFIAVGAGGWDWFAINLDDGTDLTISQVRAADGTYPLVYGTLVEPDGSVRHVSGEDVSVTATGEWTSPRTGATYPAGWSIEVPDEELLIELTPTVADQELDTRPTTGVIYWEGSQSVQASRAGEALGGAAYVELTGYADGD